MNCTQCQQPLKDGALYCEYCGHQFAVAEQKKKLNVARESVRAVLAARFHSPLFLILTICYTITLATQAGAMITGGFAGILPFIFMLISLIGMWKCYAAKTANKLTSGSIRNASVFDAYTRVMYTISIVLLCILGVLVLGLLILSGEAMADILNTDDLAVGGIVAAVAVFIFFAVIIAFVSIYRAIFANRRKFFVGLAQTSENGHYTMTKAPVIGSWFIGICSVISAGGTLLVSGIINTLFDFVIDYIGETMGETSDAVIGAMEPIMNDLGTTLLMAGVLGLASGVYYILSAIWMSSVHKAEVAAQACIAAETARLNDLERATKQAIAQRELERRKAEEAKLRAMEEERKAAELAAQKKQAAMQDQQQMMMQMMMQQMLQQNSAAFAAMFNTAAASVAEAVASTAEEAPVAEVAVSTAEEAPVAEAVASTAEEAPVAEAVASTAEEAPVAEVVASTEEEAPVAEVAVSTVEESTTAEEATPASEEPNAAEGAESAVDESPAVDESLTTEE